MTRYDPFAYGEVRLDPNSQSGGVAPDAEDMLFAEGERSKRGPPADASWDLMGDDVEDLLPGAGTANADSAEFGAEILGEGAVDDLAMADALPGGSPMSLSELDDAMPGARTLPALLAGDVEEPPAPVAPAAEPMPATEPQGLVAEPERSPTARRRVRRQELAAPARRPNSAPVAARKPVALTARSRPTVVAAMVPLVLCAGGGTAASWFWVMQGNPVMAGILGASTLVSALFAWLFLRG